VTGTRSHGSTCIRVATTLVLLVAVPDCTRLDRDRERALASPPAQRLVGVWDASFRLDRQLRIRGSTEAAPTVRGVIALIENHFGQGRFGSIGTPLHYGVYDVDFTPYGFALLDAGGVPAAAARTAAAQNSDADSVVILLNPDENGLSMSLTGAMKGDQISGVWLLENRSRNGFSAGGRFSMWRRPLVDQRRP
jgi:hypothetical protein